MIFSDETSYSCLIITASFDLRISSVLTDPGSCRVGFGGTLAFCAISRRVILCKWSVKPSRSRDDAKSVIDLSYNAYQRHCCRMIIPITFRARPTPGPFSKADYVFRNQTAGLDEQPVVNLDSDCSGRSLFLFVNCNVLGVHICVPWRRSFTSTKPLSLLEVIGFQRRGHASSTRQA